MEKVKFVLNGNKIVVLLLLFLSFSCVRPSFEVNPPDHKGGVEEKVNKAKEDILFHYKTGKMYGDIGYLEDANNYFDKAIELTLNQPECILNNPDFKEFSKELRTRIDFSKANMFEANDDDDSEKSNDDIKDEILNESEVNLSREDEQKEKELIVTSKAKYSFPIVINSKVLSFIKAYSTKLKPVIKKSIERSGRYIPMYRKIFAEEGVPDDLAYLPIIESGFRIHALSRAKAKGIWQFVKGTARLEGLRVDWWVDERCDPEKSARAAARHLKKLYEHYNDWYLALAAYNAGQGRIDRAIKKARTRDFWKLSRHRWILRRETRNYVPAFIAALIIAKQPEKYGFKDLKYEKPLEFDTIQIDSCTDLRVIARLCNTTVKEIQLLNPKLRRLTTPIRAKNFSINIPKGMKDRFLAEFKKLPPEKRVTLRYHRIRRGETLSQIARRYDTTVSAICKANRIRNKRFIRAGKTLIIPIGNGNDYYIPKVRDYTVKYRARRYKKGKKVVHRVRRGDSLYKIAVKYGTDVESIKKWNKLSTKLIKPGQRLIVYCGVSVKRKFKPEKKIKKSLPDGYYVVKEGDTIFSISRRFGLSVAELKRINRIKSNLIKPGDMLKVKDI